MAIFTGGDQNETITPRLVSTTVSVDPAGTRPSDLDDIIDGKGGNDYLVGGAGNDVIHTGPGKDRAYGGDGDDLLADDRYQDWLGNDILWGGAGNDTLRGYAGRDSLYGDAGSDFLSAGASDDYLDGGEGADQMAGGAGNDLYFVDNSLDRILEHIGQGRDTVSASISYTIPYKVETLKLTGHATLTATGSESADWLFGNSGANHLIGLGAADHLLGGRGSDTLEGGDGRDFLDGEDGKDLLKGGRGRDYLVGDAGDTLAGGPGDDYYSISSALVRIDEWRSGGTDIVLSTLRSYTLPDKVENLTVLRYHATGIGNDGDNKLEASLANTLKGGGGADTLRGSDFEDVLRGGSGQDDLWGDLGADKLIGGTGQDVFRFTRYQLPSDSGSYDGGLDTIAGGDGAAAFEGAGAARGDRIDLSRFDADATKDGLQHLTFGTSHGKGHLWTVDLGTDTLVLANINADASPEFVLQIADRSVAASAYTSADFILS